jgi:hypothetical protein
VDLSAARAIVEEHLPRYKKALGINHWDIFISFQTIEARRPRRDCDGPVGAYNSHNVCYEHARIEIDHNEVDDEATLLFRLRHELFHLILAPFTLYRHYMVQSIESGSPADHQEDNIWDFSVEQGVLALQRLWRGLVEQDALGLKGEESEMVRKSKKELPAEFVKHMGRMNGDKAPKPPGAKPKGKAATRKKGA